MLFLFSALLLILGLLSSVGLAAAGESAAELQREREELTEENRALRTELSLACSLPEIDSYARSVLGMEPCSPGQIIFIGEEQTG